VGRGRDAPRAETHSKEGVGAPRAKAHCAVPQALRVALRLRLLAPEERGGLLADSSHCQRGGVLFSALSHFAKEVGAGKDKRILLLVLDQAGWHTGGNVEVPEGIHLEFLPARSPELQPAERLWPLANEAVANGLFEELDGLEEALVKRCVALLEQTELIRSTTLYHWWPDAL
jgi:transposase